MSSDYEISDEENGYYDEDEMEVDFDDESASEIEVDGIGDDFKVAVRRERKVYDVDFTSLSQPEIEKIMQTDVDHISGIFGVEPAVAAQLLRHMDWNKEKLIEKYMDNASSVAVAAGVELPPREPTPPPPKASSSRLSSTGPQRTTRRSTAEHSKSSPKSKRTTPPVEEPKEFVCPICFDDTQTEFMALICEHKFCASCWKEYITSKVRTEAECTITCMAEDCNIVALDPFVQKALGDDKETWERYQELLVRQFVSCIPHLKFCPYPSCTYTVSCPAAATKSSLVTIVPIVTCGASNTHVFCFGCPIDSDHRPVVCAVAKMWLQKCRDDSETANWIKSNTKECSKCQSTIEKNGGCNHMTCKKCKYEFCWVCMGPWSEHGTAWYSCNRYDEKASVDARDAQTRSRASLERYLHYYNRWANHEQSAKLSMELYVKTEKKMEEMQITSELTWIQVQFMKKALDVVFRCRMTLKWTYAMAYYLASGNDKELFEDNQRDLERAVEELSELIEAPIDPETIMTLRQKVTDKTVYVQKRNEIMLEDTAKGYLEGRWKWDVTVEGFESD
ncbi:RING-5 domain-containing protein [Lentinus tigrinus ALCF2SS1-7]|uniref:RBR-type E3 ubiquitin transferase n=1 Tax=Lentinus tigrinus ALCF2SS1-6 TaxID=1328759 RepID=A0A5C2RS69_9APHY|nr:RING-5 domain-containing protein [Lentinus tigrinus ALCF2SS1-6]RPD69598.1 RING-5 domain-containing protein [Lentinus tigrinus ALCF2SS1-7]